MKTYRKKIADTVYEIKCVGDLSEVTVLNVSKKKTYGKRRGIPVDPFVIQVTGNKKDFFDSESNWNNTILPLINEARKKLKKMHTMNPVDRRKDRIKRGTWEVARWVESNKKYKSIMSSDDPDLGFNKGIEMWYKDHPDEKRSRSTIQRYFRQAAQKLSRFFPSKILMKRGAWADTDRQAYGSMDFN